MKTGWFKPVYLFLLVAFLTETPASAKNPLDEKQALDLLIVHIKKDKLYDSWTSLACLSFVTEKNTKNHVDIAIHEKHGGNCPGDPDTTPIVDRFRLHRLNQKIQWYDQSTGSYQPYRGVVKYRLEK